MGSKIQCPRCGAAHELVNPGITMLVCDSCQGVVYRGGDQGVRIGAEAIVPESDARLFSLATGTLGGRGYRVVGRVRYDYGRGGWDEWYLQLDDGSVAWLSEDERELTHQEVSEPEGPVPREDDVAVGLPLTLDGIRYTVREVGTARCAGVEGQLPFPVVPDEEYTYANLVSDDGQSFASLEYDEDHAPTFYVGRPLGHEDLVIEGEKPPATTSTQGENITCGNCGGPVEVPGGRVVETRVCDYCGAQLDLSEEEQHVLGVNPEGMEPGFLLEVGHDASFDGRRYEVCGRMLYREPEYYETREYLLFHPDGGYLWLAEEDGHWVLNRVTQKAPSVDPTHVAPRTTVRVGDDGYRKYEAGVTTLVYVDGALPWRARVGDAFGYVDLVAPPKMFGVEEAAGEVEYFEGEYMEPDAVWQAFELEGSPPRRKGVHAAQPFRRSRAVLVMMVVGGILALVNGGLALWSLSQEGEVVFNGRFGASDYAEGATSEPFAIPEGSSVVKVKTRANVSNSWIYLDMALVNADDQVVSEMSSEVSYYHGYSGGESWTEGSLEDERYFRAPAPGEYRLILKGSGGSGLRGPPRNETAAVEIRAGPVMSRYFLIAFLVALLIPGLAITQRILFEVRRWAPVVEDEDD